jgi:hypothetical protein
VNVTFQPVRVDTGGPDEEGSLAFMDDRLAVVLVRLSDQHGSSSGHWFVEAAFGPYDGPNHPTFPDVGAATEWLLERAATRDNAPG